MGELGILPAHQRKPGDGKREIERDARHRVQSSPGSEVARHERIEHQRGARDDQRDQALGQRRARGRRIRYEHPVALRGRRERRPLREQERAQRDGEPEREDGIERQQVREAGVPNGSRQHQCGVGAGVGARQSCRGEPHRDDRQQPGHRRGQPRRPFVDAKGVERRRAQPILKRRLLEILEVVEPWRDPVAAHRHLARDLGVAAFVRMLQLADIERREPGDERDEREQPPGAAGKGSKHRVGKRWRPRGARRAVCSKRPRAFYRAAKPRSAPGGTLPRTALRPAALCL